MNPAPTSPPRVTVRRTPAAVLALSFAALTLEGYDLIVYGAVAPSLLDHHEWALTSERVGYLGSLAVFGMLVGALVAGALTDRIGRRRVLIGGVVTFSVAMGLCAVAPSPGQFGFFRFMVGVGAGGLMPTVVALLLEYSPAHRRSLNTALAFAGVGIGGALAGILAVVLVPAYGFRIMFALGLAPLAVVLPLMLRYLPESVEFLRVTGRSEAAAAVARRYDLHVAGPLSQEQDPVTVDSPSRAGVRAVFAREYLVGTLLFWVATFLCLLVLFGANAWLPALMVKAGYGLRTSVSFLLVLNLGAAAGTLAASPVADRVGSRPVVAGAFLAAAASLALLALHPPAVLVYVLVAVAGVGTTGTQILLNTFVGSYYPTRSRGTGLGLSLSVGRLGGVLGPTYGGYLLASDVAPAWYFYAFAIPAVLGSVVIAAVPVVGADPLAANAGALPVTSPEKVISLDA